MKTFRRLSAAIFLISALFYLTACGHSNNTAQAAGSNGASGPAPVGTQSAEQALTIPEGARIDVRLDDYLSTNRNHSGDTFEATLVRPIELPDGSPAVPAGAHVTGEVVSARASGHMKTPAEISVALTSLEVDGNSYSISTSRVSRRGRSHKGRNLKWIGGSAAGGALLGALIGHGKGAAIGALVGGGGGTAAAYATGKQNIALPSETQLHFVLEQPVTINRAG